LVQRLVGCGVSAVTHRVAVGLDTWNRSAARATGHPRSTTQRASRSHRDLLNQLHEPARAVHL